MMDRLSLPTGSTAVDVGIIDSTARLTVPASHLLSPATDLDGVTLTAPSYSFFIAHPSGRKILFDLGLRKDWWNLTPTTNHFLKSAGWKLEVTKNVSDILQENGEALEDIEAVVWSHHHFDHVGDMSAFPETTKIIVGPGFKRHYTPAYPSNRTSTLFESDWENHSLHELSFDESETETLLQIGPFNAIDYFGDGSFYILDAPGHTFGHIAALARVAADRHDPGKNNFVFMGGDTCHFAGQFRPTVERPLPGEGAEYTSEASQIQPNLQHQAQAQAWASTAACPGSIMERLLANPTTPLFEMPATNTVDVAEAHASISKMQAFDAAENIWVVIAHDQALLDLVDFYPASVNDWQRKGYAQKTRWRFWNTLARKKV
ncbi:beta-lactamase-like protein [Aspergillus pseudodeflectus]|uniref:Beta-lactamase-like protein n=1 Tax=Aspergillus pseudodeflectus TaxID=176178 RepID=A0ABR4JS40_9EURO